MQQQTGGNLAVGRVLFYQRARGQDGGLEHFVDGDAVVQVLDRFLQDGFAVDEFVQAFAGGDDGRAQFSQVQRAAHAGIGHVQHVRGRRRARPSASEPVRPGPGCLQYGTCRRWGGCAPAH
ncbi:hypothetical protein G6F35_017874 [Rhizopus arrhizus]|nr:hypothetical protein G6F35_017874 [Rhizopus arrhizus]